MPCLDRDDPPEALLDLPAPQLSYDPQAIVEIARVGLRRLSRAWFPVLVYLGHGHPSEALRAIKAMDGVCGVVIAGVLPEGLHADEGFFSHILFDAPLPEGLPQARTILSLCTLGLPLRACKAAGCAHLVYRELFQWRHVSTLNQRCKVRYEHLRNHLPQRFKHRLPSGELLPSLLFHWEDRIRARVRNLLRFPLPFAIDPVPGRVVMTNATLRNGGAERQLVSTLRGLREFGLADVRLLCRRLTDSLEHGFHLENVRRLGYPVSQVRHEDGYRLDPDQARAYRKLSHNPLGMPPHIASETLRYALEIIQLRPSVLHVWLDTLPAAMAGLMVGVPKVILFSRSLSLATHAKTYLPALSVRTQMRMPFDPTLRPIYQALLESPCLQLCNNSHAGQRDYAAWLGVSQEKIRVIYNGIDYTRWQRGTDEAIAQWKQTWGIPEGKKIVGSLFRMTSTKDPRLWIQTAARVAQVFPDTEFVVFGDGAERNTMRRLATEAGFGERLHLPGVTHEVPMALSMMDVLLLTSLVESTPNVLIEAQLLGVPVVVTNVGGTPETVLHGTTGWLVSGRDPLALADRVGYCLQDDEWREMVAHVASPFIRERFSLSRMLENVLELYGLHGDKKG